MRRNQAKNRSILQRGSDIHAYAYVFFKLTNFLRLPLRRPVGFRRNEREREHVRARICSRMRDTRPLAYGPACGSTPILPRAALFSISITAARERADVFFSGVTK